VGLLNFLHFRFLDILNSGSMKKLAPLSCFLAVTFLFLQAAFGSPSGLSGFQNLVVFGDSLSDNGNSFFQAGVPVAPYYQGRYSNGPLWVDDFPAIAKHFPPITAYLSPLHGTNFAFAGATSANLADQINWFASSPYAHNAANNLYVIWIGANDFGVSLSPLLTVQNIRNAIGHLAALGARDIVVINVPDISLTPFIISLGCPTIRAAKEFVFTTDILLDFEVPLAGWTNRVRTEVVDINSIFTQIVYCPIRFRFTNSSGAAYDPVHNTVVTDPDDYVFWDGFHPTQRVHLIAAEFIYRSIIAQRRIGALAFSNWP
jgi:phospholipase/lecithinase/hemolysin